MTTALLIFWFWENQHDSSVSRLHPFGRHLISGDTVFQWSYHHRHVVARGAPRPTTTNSTAGPERFASLFHSELVQRFGFTKRGNVAPDLIATLKNMESLGITTVMFSSPWDWLQPAEKGATRFQLLDALANATCKNTKLKVAFILDMVRAPEWVFNKWPDAKAVDSHMKSYKLLSWFHPSSNKLAIAILVEIVTLLANKHPGCVTAVQPVYSNEYEARYSQENDCFQDYSQNAILSFQQWLQARSPDLDDLNGRWGTNFTSWETVTPPLLEAGSFMGADITPRYWDFISFRELHGAQVLNRACAAVQAAGVRCFHHVPELFTVLDAVYGTTLFKQIAASSNTDFIIINSNFKTSYGDATSPTKTQLNVAAAAAYGKQVYFEASLEHSPSLESLQSVVTLALMAGAEGVGISNWLGKYDLNPELLAALQPVVPSCPVTELVGVFIHLDSCSAFHGLQWAYPRKDPVHDLVQSISEKLAASNSCGGAISVYLELSALVAELPSLDRVVFIEPVVLLGDAQLELYAQAKEAVRGMQHQFVQLPLNQTRGIRVAVIPDL
ncbi:hypothetical protein Vretimale_13659 [Volvox reticuliferus]|nr:hypothetical protein Vretimale_13659 [Volvox reticuliferus]